MDELRERDAAAMRAVVTTARLVLRKTGNATVTTGGPCFVYVKVDAWSALDEAIAQLDRYRSPVWPVP